MKPFSAKTRKDTQSPLQLDFLSSVQNPILPMKPIEPSPDGTPPLPLLPPRPAPLEADIFESDPFFQTPPSGQPPEPESVVPFAVVDELEPDEIPFPIDTPEALLPADPASPTAEERLLNTIVREPLEKESAHAPSLIDEARQTRLILERDIAIEEARKASIARDKAKQELLSFKTRAAALDTELAAARETLAQATQSRAQIETRFAEAEKQWTDKLSHLRHLLDEVEDTRDEVIQKRVPRLLFIGTLAAGIIATLFAYLIGLGQSSPPSVMADHQPMPQAVFPTATPALPPEPSVAITPPPPAPVMSPATETAGPVAPLLSPPPTTPTPAPSPRQKKTVVRAPEKTATWPTLKGDRWTASSSSKEMKVVFNYGIFTRGVELSTAARQDLKAIASTLKGEPFHIEVEGHTDSAKVSKTKAHGTDNQAIGLARAKVVSIYLANTCGLPTSMLSVSSAGEAHPPYPNTTAAGQQKNRTVVLKITAR